MYFTSKSLSPIQGDLGIHPSTIKNCLEGSNYLDFFKITNIPIEGAILANLSVSDLANLIYKQKSLFLSNTSRTKFSKQIAIKEVATGTTMEFSSISSLVNHFKTMNITMDRNKIAPAVPLGTAGAAPAAKILNTGKVYKGYLFTELI